MITGESPYKRLVVDDDVGSESAVNAAATSKRVAAIRISRDPRWVILVAQAAVAFVENGIIASVLPNTLLPYQSTSLFVSTFTSDGSTCSSNQLTVQIT